MMLSNKSKINVAKFVEIEKKILNSQKTILIFFNVIFLMKVDFFCFCCKLILLNFRKVYIKEYYLRSSKINVKTFYYFSIKNETQDTTLFFENKKIEHALHFFVQTKRAIKTNHFDYSDYTCSSSVLNERRYVRFVKNKKIIFNTS